MPREPYVTRNFRFTEIRAIFSNGVLEHEIAVHVKGTYPPGAEDRAFKRLKHDYKHDILTPVKVLSVRPYRDCLGMPESEFLKFARKCDITTRHPPKTGEEKQQKLTEI